MLKGGLPFDTHSRTLQRQFGAMLAVFCLGMAAYRAWRHGETPIAWGAVGIAFAGFAVAWPAGLRPLLTVWLWLAVILNKIFSTLLLTLTFYAILTPIALVRRLVAQDPLHRKWDRDAASYWQTPDEQPTDIKRYYDQF